MLRNSLLTTDGYSTLPGKFRGTAQLRWLTLLFGLLLIAPLVRAQSQTVFVNELIYDSNQLVGSTIQEVVPNLIEIAGPASTNVNSWSLVFYERVTNNSININQGRVYGSAVITGIIPDQENGYGTLAFTFPPATLTNDPGGIAVVSASGVVTNFISYEGVPMTALDGPAAGLVARQTTTHSATDNNQSIQLQGTGSVYTDFTWSPLFTKTPGQVNKAFINNKQVFVQPTFVNISVSTNTITEGATSNTLVATVTASRPVVGNQSVTIAGSGTNITGDDFGLQFLTVTILSGTTSGTTLVTIKNDTDVEGTETLRLTISNPSASVFLGPTTTQDITILDDDVPPVLIATPTALSFSTVQRTPSAQQTYVLSATALASAITVTAPAGVEISQVSGAGFTNSFTLSRLTTSATVYVRLSASAPVSNAFTGTITNVSGSQTANVAVTGTISASTAPNQAPVATANANQTATVGVNFSYVVNAFTDPNGDVLTYTATGLPAGLTFDAATRTISGVASASGVSTVTVTATDPGSLSASTTFTITVNPAPVTPPANQAPVATTNANQTATVGVNFSYVVNAFTDPNGDVLTYTATGLPAGLSFDASTRTISGVASASGVSTVTVTATDPGSLSASTTFTSTVNPAPVTPPANQAPVAVFIPNLTATVGANFSFTFNPFTDPNGDVLTYSVSGLPAGLSFDASTRTISGVASASGVSTVTVTATDPGSLSASTTFTITVNLAPVTPPTPGSFAITGVTTVTCATVTAGLRTLTFAPQYSGTNGQSVTFIAVNEALPTTAPGPYTLNLYIDNPTITLKATQSGTTGESVFSYNWLAACGGGSNPPTPGSFAITGVTTVNCAVVSPGLRTLTFAPQYSGTNGQPVTFIAVNEALPTTAPGPYTLNLYTDNPTITLKAIQDGTAGEATFRYNWLAACGGARRGVEPGAALQVRVLGNPVYNTVEVEVTGAQGAALNLSLIDTKGRLAGQSRSEQAGAVERHRFNVSAQPDGVFLLRVSTGIQTRTVRILKTK